MLGTTNDLKLQVFHLQLTPVYQNLIYIIKFLREAIDWWLTKVNLQFENSVSNAVDLPLPFGTNSDSSYQQWKCVKVKIRKIEIMLK